METYFKDVEEKCFFLPKTPNHLSGFLAVHIATSRKICKKFNLSLKWKRGPEESAEQKVCLASIFFTKRV